MSCHYRESESSKIPGVLLLPRGESVLGLWWFCISFNSTSCRAIPSLVSVGNWGRLGGEASGGLWGCMGVRFKVVEIEQSRGSSFRVECEWHGSLLVVVLCVCVRDSVMRPSSLSAVEIRNADSTPQTVHQVIPQLHQRSLT